MPDGSPIDQWWKSHAPAAVSTNAKTAVHMAIIGQNQRTDKLARVITIEPLLLALLPLAGVLFTVGAGLLGAWLQSRREHVRWLRERRLEAYLNALTFLHQLKDERIAIENQRARMATLHSRIEELRRALRETPTPEMAASLSEEVHAARDSWEAQSAEMEIAKARAQALRESMIDRLVSFDLLGPKMVDEAASAFLRVQGEEIGDLEALNEAMRRALAIRY